MKKLLIPAAIISTLYISANAQTTMCFKKNHKDITTIEDVKLNGGDCNGAYSLNEMKKDGWKTNDIKITTNQDGSSNFVYILKKGENLTDFSNYNSEFSQEELEQRIMKRLVEKKKQDQEKAKQEQLQASITNGEVLYSSCVSCHGLKGEKSAYNVAKPLNTLSANEMDVSISSYTNDSSYGYGYQTIMKQYATNLTEDKLKDIKAYLDSVNNKNQELETK